METNNREDIEIDVKELFFVVIGKIWIIIAAGILCTLITGIFTKTMLKPIYESTTKIYVVNKQDSEKATTYSDLQTGAQLTKDYQILIESRIVTEQVINKLKLNLTHEELLSYITVNNPIDTRIIEVTVKYTDPVLAKKIADTIGEISAESMVSVMEMEKVNIVEPGNLPTAPSSPNLLKNVVVGGLAGAFLSAFIILFVFIMDDTIKKSEDIEKYLGLTTLGTIPLEESIVESRRVKAAKKKALKKYKGGISNAIY
jgi:capsular polysaccharide biosynthesis protein